MHDRSSFDQLIARRNRRESLGFALAVLGLVGATVLFVARGQLPLAASAAATALGAGFVVHTLRTRGANPEGRLRDALLHQAALLDDVARWYIAPLVPGVAGICLVAGWSRPLPLLAVVAGLAVLAWVAVGINRGAARHLRAQAEELASNA